MNMRFQINAGTLSRVLGAIARNIPANPAQAVFRGVRLAVDGNDGNGNGVLTITVGDGDLCVNVSVAVPADSAKGTAIVSDARIFTDLVRSFAPEQTIEVEDKDGKAVITWDGGMASLPVLESDVTLDTSVLDEERVESGVAFDCQDLRSCIQTVIPAVANDEIRPNICGIRFAFREGEMDIVGTDSRSLSIRTVNISGREGSVDLTMSKPISAAVVSLLDIKELRRAEILSDIRFARVSFAPETPEPGEGESEEAKTVEVLRAEVRGSLVRGNYPAYAQVIPSADGARECVADRKALLGAVKRTAICANRVKTFTRLSIEPEGLRLSTSDIYSNSDAEETVPAQIPEGESVDIVLDTAHLLRALNAVRTDSVRILFSQPTRPVLVSEAEGEDEDDTVRCVIAASREMEGMPVGKKKKKSE